MPELDEIDARILKILLEDGPELSRMYPEAVANRVTLTMRNDGGRGKDKVQFKLSRKERLFLLRQL